MNYKYYGVISLLLGLAMPIVCNAQDSTSYGKNYSLEEINVTATKLNTKLKDVATRIDVIDEKSIERTNGTRLPDVIKTIPEVFVKSYGLTSALQTVSINGLGAEHTLVLFDGVKINSYQNSGVDLSLLPKNDLERIEVINNGASSIYGSMALGGVINIVSKNRGFLSNGRSSAAGVVVSKGGFNTNHYSVGFYQQFNKFNARVYYTKETSDGNYKYHYDNGIETVLKERENAGYSLSDAGINSQYVINNNNVVRFISTYTDQDKDVPGIETGSAPAATNQKDRNWNNILIVDNDLSKTFSLKSSFNLQNNYEKYTVGTYTDNYYKNTVYAATTELQFKKNRYGFTTGYNYAYAQLSSNAVETCALRNEHALFISSFYKILEQVRVFPSARYDYISDIDEGAFTYNVGINYQPFQTIGLSLKGNVGKNFRAPSFNDLYWETSGNPDLEPEHSTNYEAGFLYAFPKFLKGDFEFTYTHIDAENKVVWSPVSGTLWAPQNIAESVSNNFAINTALLKEINDDLTIQVNGGIQFTNSKKTSETYSGDTSKDKYIQYVPRQSAKVNLYLQYKFTGLNIYYSHIGVRYIDAYNRYSLTPVNLVDANILLNLKVFEINSQIKMEVNNLMNTDYQFLSGYPMPLRNFRLTFSINY